VIAGIGGVLSVPVGWLVTDALESADDFCNACHLSRGVPLHIELRRDFDSRPPASLAALHAAQPPAAAGSPAEGRAFRCIDCHGGVGLVGKARVKLLAARDAFWWTVRRFEEPTAMRWPLWDADCRQCHERFEVKGDELGYPAFHDLPPHNVELGVGCVECHDSHDPGGNADAWFLHAAPVRRQCVRCHPQYKQLEEGAE
jgi:hypothetical protein